LYKWQSKVTALIATLSYGIYLLHKGAIHITQTVLAKFGLDTSSVMVMLICIASCVLFALALHYVVERPFMQMRDRILRRAPRREPAPEAGDAELPALSE
jgi:peptidoglycan/LPS O-acetylase OafA/YrhL